MTVFSVPGADLAVELVGEDGPPVAQLHGLASSRRRDQLLGLDLCRELRGARLLRYDARGHGRSTGRPDPEDYRWQTLADDLLRLLDHFFPDETVHAVGTSMGTGTLLHAALRAPDRFSRLTLALPPTAWETRAAKRDEYLRAAALVERLGAEQFLAISMATPRPPAAPEVPKVLPDVAAALLPALYRGAAAADLPAPEEIAGIVVPTRLLAWVDDPAHPESTADRLLDLLPQARLQVARSPADVDDWPGTVAAERP